MLAELPQQRALPSQALEGDPVLAQAHLRDLSPVLKTGLQ
jgi:hypothetical protein